MTHHVLTEAAGETQANGNILEVRDLKKYFLIKKEWKLKKIALPDVGEAAELGPQGEIAEAVGEEVTSPANDEIPAEAAEAVPKEMSRFKRKIELEKTYVKAVDGVSFDVPYGKTLAGYHRHEKRRAQKNSPRNANRVSGSVQLSAAAASRGRDHRGGRQNS